MKVMLMLLSLPIFCLGQSDQINWLYQNASAGNLKNVRELVEQKGANVNSQAVFDYTPLMIAAWEGHMDVVQYLVDHGANVNAQGTNGSTALMEAVWGEHPDIAKFLISKKADVNAQIPAHNTIYTVAVWKHENEIVNILKSMSAKESPTYP